MKLKMRILYISIGLLSLCYIVYLCFHVLTLEKNSNIGVKSYISQSPEALSDDWHYKWGDSSLDKNGKFLCLSENFHNNGWESYEFPGKPPNPLKQRTIWITTQIPKGNWKSPTLTFRAPQQSIEVYMEGKLIYSFAKMDFTNKNNIPGSIWHFVTLPEGSEGKNIYFRSYSPSAVAAGYMIDIYAGEKSDLILNILRSYGKSLILGSLFVFIGLILLSLSIIRTSYRKSLLSLGSFTFSIGLWSIAEGKILQLFFNISVIPVYIANISIFLVPIGFIYFVLLVFEEDARLDNLILKRVWQLFIVLAVVTFLLDMFELKSSIEMDVFLHILIGISIPLLLSITIRSAKKGSKEAFVFLIGLSALSITALYDIYIMFYIAAPDVNPVRITEWGMLVLVLSLVFIIGRKLSLLYEKLKVNLYENETNYKSLFKNMTDSFIYTRIIQDSKGIPNDNIIIDINPAFLSNSGMKKEQVIGTKLNDILPGWKAVWTEMFKSYEEIAACDNLQGNDLLFAWGKWYKASSFSPKTGFMCIILSDITEMKNAESTIRRQAYTDSMTGFFNRTYFEDVMIRMVNLHDDLKPVSFISIDIDGLKITNDTFGHKIGDELLIEAGKIISSVVSSQGIIARVGGDEFCVILPETNYEAASTIREEIVRRIEIENSKNPIVPISMSIGIASSNQSQAEDIYSIYRRADDDMYQYKLSQSGSEKSKLIDMLLTALSERDYVAQGHVERLAQMAESMADILELQDAEKRNLVLLAKVHDLGKIGISDKILFKSGKLSKEEYEQMKLHAKVGYNIANRSRELVNIATLILHHHEHWDGKGYPDGLKGEEIPLECRILSVIDAYDAMTSMRPYHKGISKKEAINEIKRCSGTQFDPVMVEKFISLSEKLQ